MMASGWGGPASAGRAAATYKPMITSDLRNIGYTPLWLIGREMPFERGKRGSLHRRSRMPPERKRFPERAPLATAVNGPNVTPCGSSPALKAKGFEGG